MSLLGLLLLRLGTDAHAARACNSLYAETWVYVASTTTCTRCRIESDSEPSLEALSLDTSSPSQKNVLPKLMVATLTDSTLRRALNSQQLPLVSACFPHRASMLCAFSQHSAVEAACPSCVGLD